jgi:hypothetical protein
MRFIKLLLPKISNILAFDRADYNFSIFIL